MCCPCCGQGKIEKAIIKNCGEIIHICSECDVVWTVDEEISINTGLNLKNFAAARNIKLLWTDLELL